MQHPWGESFPVNYEGFLFDILNNIYHVYGLILFDRLQTMKWKRMVRNMGKHGWGFGE